MRRLIALLAMGTMFGCGTTKYSTTWASQTGEFGVVYIGDNAGYLIDPRTETCVLFSAVGAASGTVDCAKLKASVPEAAQYITWDARVSRR